MSAYTPIPESPADLRHWRELLEPYLRLNQIELERDVEPSFETLGRLATLRADLATDITDLQSLAADVDSFVHHLASIKSESHSEQGGRDADWRARADHRAPVGEVAAPLLRPEGDAPLRWRIS